MRIGIMGGTFDPIHNGHLMLGEYAYQQFHLDEVWYMPNGNPPHKSNPEIRKDLQDRAEMTRLAKQLPEYDTVRAMYGVGETTAAQLMAEIGDVRRFPRRSSIVGFAGVDPAVDQSGKHEAKSTPTTKRGSPHLRKTLYQIVCTYLKRSPVDEPVYQFLDKKRSEGKPYFVYMTAAQNKFLRIYYARVKECLEAFDAQQDTSQR